jgi:hypothetical protein
MNKSNNSALVLKSSSAIEKAESGTKRVLSGMVADTLAHAQAQKVSVSPAVTGGQIESWYKTGKKFYHGQGVPQDYAEAVRWFRKAAEQGYSPAQTQLGICYLHGQGVKKDAAAGASWIRKAADQGFAYAQGILGYVYLLGKGVSKNHDEAVKWFRKAADQGNAHAHFALKMNGAATRPPKS